MTPPKNRRLSDTDEELAAVAGKAGAQEAIAGIETMSSSDQMDARVNQHKLDCWDDEGPLGKLRNDVQEIKSWSKGVIVAVAILGLLNAYSVFFTQHGPVPLPSFSAAHASK